MLFLKEGGKEEKIWHIFTISWFYAVKIFHSLLERFYQCLNAQAQIIQFECLLAILPATGFTNFHTVNQSDVPKVRTSSTKDSAENGKRVVWLDRAQVVAVPIVAWSIIETYQSKLRKLLAMTKTSQRNQETCNEKMKKKNKTNQLNLQLSKT